VLPDETPRPLRSVVLAALLSHGLRPTPSTPVALLRTQVRDLYLYEIRQLRRAVRRGAFPLDTYAARVVALRTRYPLLSLPLDQWHEPDAARPLR
jgi:hypothetical protein